MMISLIRSHVQLLSCSLFALSMVESSLLWLMLKAGISFLVHTFGSMFLVIFMVLAYNFFVVVVLGSILYTFIISIVVKFGLLPIQKVWIWFWFIPFTAIFLHSNKMLLAKKNQQHVAKLTHKGE
ncbi:hypothetical protein NXZ84_13495 [Mechercharimyces sp. CAU 1602]|nr:hypothetical protein [Mechercharimyces sp. CAU 1602]